jgi:Cu/Ag efflux protein CusF
VKSSTLVVCALLLSACSRTSSNAGPKRHYALSGKIVALDAQHQIATVDAEAIPNFMEAMTMDYPVESKDEFRSLRVGEQITARVDVAEDDRYALSNIKPRAAK